MAGFVVWFTGLSGSGKSTLAAMLSAELRARGVHVEVLDGDDVRTHLSKGLGFSKEDRDTNVRRIGFVAKLIARSGACAMTAAISPYKAIRDEQRALIGAFCEVYCECPIPALAARDPKGLYNKAIAGEIKGFTGIDAPYEAPDNADVVVQTDRESKEASLAKILTRLENLGFIAHGGESGRSLNATSALPRPHGGELVNLFSHASDRASLEDRAKSLPCIAMNERASVDFQCIAEGTYSPLRGFMNQKDYLCVVREARLENGLPWAYPITLSIDADRGAAIRQSREVALQSPDGRVVGLLEVSDVFIASDGAAPESLCVGGEIIAFDWMVTAGSSTFATYRRGPAATRAIFAERGWSHVVGFVDPSPILRAHEYLAKTALETVDGLLFGVSVGASVRSPRDEAMVRCAEAILSGYFPANRALLAIHSALGRGGPREAIAQAIVLKNHGCSHVAIQSSIGGFGDHSASDLGITELRFEEAFYSTKNQSMATAKTAPEDSSARIATSVDAVIDSIRSGASVSPDIARPEVIAILSELANP